MSRAVVIGLAETGIAVSRRLRAEGWDLVVLEDAPGSSDSYAARSSPIPLTRLNAPTKSMNGSVGRSAGALNAGRRSRLAGTTSDAASGTLPITSWMT